ncbi:16S rRNA (guanine(966)-N(2))-methyltransferase RsmD [Apilactobacillus xinyiensis]|uniref:16S rRNA (Guanine(966)-N(2))-methyltransferase RsmD n=1 Tax=Apilactobacillus xinyiensis TaxID=2841032 RepID=A0ABT0I1W9_9LACO|nr:16S rRNA (guanine(966)-N(2))-methyltransferase RsmD [Apilactobacillus xinyiensis]MCK8624721.1 16S rRNA (guanine(966)-N(2))-methyltransferase RsmD [Apilactobacillus xinyiensis]MCL0318836.1 16S rRNA (guanine(966)-N(2))-methyltransferase RsmD [Apilactobacillus xinyiensis]MCL0329922.1 16S rRNA (guanine(966)-N(2))-methyltransferase RsmD [Apilactobacillus xinyiensis]
MRVISGEFRSRFLKPVPGDKTRPTTDKVKESIFNMIGPYFESGSFLDLFAGSGNVGIEAVSRGMHHATLVDKQYAAIKTIKENVAVTKKQDNFSIIKSDANLALNKLSQEGRTFDIIFLDPPYKNQKMVDHANIIKNLSLLNSNGILICETDNSVHLEDNISGYKLINQKNYGLTVVTIYKFLG